MVVWSRTAPPPKAQLLRDRLSRHDNQESSVERRLADGRWILINERRSDAGTIVLYTDVTDLKRREEQLQLAKNRAEQANVELEKTIRRLDIALGNMTQGLCLFDSQLHSILCNRRYAKIFRLPPELTGPGASLHAQISHVAAQGKADEAEAVALVDDRLSYAASRARCTYRLALPDKRIIEVIHQPLPDGGAVETFTEVAADAPQALVFSGKEEGAATNGAAAPGEARDESGDSAAALALARDEARSADRGKAEFLRAFGHALKASLETIVDTSEAMTGAVYGPLGDERYRQFAKSIRDSGNALMSMIDDIEEISTLTAGEIELSEQQLDLGQLLARCIRLARHSADGEPPSISIAAPCEGYRIRADETKLRQAFLNLLSNAVRFTPAKGRIEVSIDAADDGGLAVAIADTGGGVPAKIVSALMGRAETGNGARRPNGKDSHLGLPVVKSLIERHGGRLVLDSAKGKGTTAVVHIPIRGCCPDPTRPEPDRGRLRPCGSGAVCDMATKFQRSLVSPLPWLYGSLIRLRHSSRPSAEGCKSESELMAYWLIKSEPNTWSWDQQVAAGVEEWDGIRNHQAKNNLLAMRQGDWIFFYHSVVGTEIVGIVEVAAEAHPDSTDPTGKWFAVDVRPVRPFAKPVTLQQIKADPSLSDMALVKNSRLSVQPVTAAEWQLVCRMGETDPS